MKADPGYLSRLDQRGTWREAGVHLENTHLPVYIFGDEVERIYT